MLMSDELKYPKTLAPVQNYPVHANQASGLLKRTEPLITPKQLKSRFLKGIFEKLPLEARYSDTELKDQINLAVNELEAELKVPIFAERFTERVPYDFTLYKSYIHIRTNHGPIRSVENFRIVSSDRTSIFTIPAQWVDTGQFHNRQISVIPLLASYTASAAISATGTSIGAAFLVLVTNSAWVPAYWEIDYVAGLCGDKGQVPIVVNQLIGAIASINILSNLASLNQYNSVSIGQDGISQSHSGLGPQIYATRIQDLTLKKQELLKQLQRMFQQKIYVGTI
jgi:hypothetical protein